MTLKEMSALEACKAVAQGPVVARCADGWMLLQSTSKGDLIVGTIGCTKGATAMAASVYEEVQKAAALTGLFVAVKGARLGVTQVFDTQCLFQGDPEDALKPTPFIGVPESVAVSDDAAKLIVALGDIMLKGWQGHLGLFPYCGVEETKIAAQRAIAQGAYDSAKGMLEEAKRPCLW